MNEEAIIQAAQLLIEARRSGERLPDLPAPCRPSTVADAHAIQDRVTQMLDERVGGWKVNAPPGGETTRGTLFASLLYPSPARIPARRVPLLGVEAEIAFRFERDLPARPRDYARDEISDAVTAFPAIEVVDARFRDHDKVTLLERVADNIINGAFVYGAPVAGWRDLDLSRLSVSQAVDGKVQIDKIGGHPSGDPLLPAVALVNHLRLGPGLRAGQVVTTGSFTGMSFVKPGQTVTVQFERLGVAEVTFVA